MSYTKKFVSESEEREMEAGSSMSRVSHCGGRPGDGGSIPSRGLCVQTSSGAHPASYAIGTGGSFPGGKAWPGRDSDHSSPSSAEVMHE